MTPGSLARDFTEAARWFHRAAAQGHAEGQSYLGAMYDDGRGRPAGLPEAVRWYQGRLAVDQRQAQAQSNHRGAMCADGTGVPQDFTETVRCYRLAADQGHAIGQYNLGEMHYCTRERGSRRTSPRPPGCSSSPATRGSSPVPAGQAAGPGLPRQPQTPAGTGVQIVGLAAAAAVHRDGRRGTVVTPTKPLAAGRIADRIRYTTARPRVCRSPGSTWGELAPAPSLAKPRLLSRALAHTSLQTATQ